jgi:hypothetical protein
MSYSANRRDALNPVLPIGHRMSHARSCAMLMGEKYKVDRSVIIDLVRQSSGVDLMVPGSDSDMIEAFGMLDRIKSDGLRAASTGGQI